LQPRTGGFDEKKDHLEKSRRLAQRTTVDHDADAAVPFTLVIESELDLGSLGEMPFGQQSHTLGRPVDVIADETDRIGKADRHLAAKPGFAGKWHKGPILNANIYVTLKEPVSNCGGAAAK